MLVLYTFAASLPPSSFGSAISVFMVCYIYKLNNSLYGLLLLKNIFPPKFSYSPCGGAVDIFEAGICEVNECNDGAIVVRDGTSLPPYACLMKLMRTKHTTKSVRCILV